MDFASLLRRSEAPRPGTPSLLTCQTCFDVLSDDVQVDFLATASLSNRLFRSPSPRSVRTGSLRLPGDVIFSSDLLLQFSHLSTVQVGQR